MVVKNVGASLKADTLNRKLSDTAVCTPSLTKTVTVEDPLASICGVKTSEQLGAVPNFAMLARGSTPGLLGVTVTAEQSKIFPLSFIVNGMEPVGMSSIVDWVGMSDMVGGVVSTLMFWMKPSEPVDPGLASAITASVVEAFLIVPPFRVSAFDDL